MNDTVQKLMTLADEWADECGGCDSGHLAAHSAHRQALEAELTRLFTPLTDGPVHQHKWFKTGAMEPGEWRCIDCGELGKENQHGITGEGK